MSALNFNCPASTFLDLNFPRPLKKTTQRGASILAADSQVELILKLHWHEREYVQKKKCRAQMCSSHFYWNERERGKSYRKAFVSPKPLPAEERESSGGARQCVPGSGEQTLHVWRAGRHQQSFGRRVASAPLNQCILDRNISDTAPGAKFIYPASSAAKRPKIVSVPKYLTDLSSFLFWVKIFKVSCKLLSWQTCCPEVREIWERGWTENLRIRLFQ